MKVDIEAIQAAEPSQRIAMSLTFISTDVAQLKAGSEARERAEKLISALNAETAPSSGAAKETATQKMVRHKLNRFKKLSGQLDAEQRRELLIILFCGMGKLPIEQRKDAFALLQLRGEKESRAFVCAAFPGLRVAFERENS